MKNLKLTMLILSIMYTLMGNAQKEWNNWIMGYNIHHDFNDPAFPIGTYPFSTITNYVSASKNTNEGTASYSDPKTGKLLLYSDGLRVYDDKYEVIPDLLGSTSYFLSNVHSTTQQVLIVPFPDSNKKFYVFTINPEASLGAYSSSVPGLFYSIVNLEYSSPLDKRIENLNIHLNTNSLTEKMTCTSSCDGGYWVVVHGAGDNLFYSYKINSSGISAPVISSAGSVHSIDVCAFLRVQGTIGAMKFSKDATKIAVAVQQETCTTTGFIEVLNFDNSTGVVSATGPDYFKSSSLSAENPYGVCFSPDSKILYVTCGELNTRILYQYDFNVAPPTQTKIFESSENLGKDVMYGDLQITPDMSKILITVFGEIVMDEINSPNTPGLGCNHTVGSFYPTYFGPSYLLSLGLPNNIYSDIPSDPSSITAGSDITICKGNCTTLGAPLNPDPNIYDVVYIWSDLSLGNSPNPEVCPTTTTTYHLTVIIEHSCLPPIESDVTVTVEKCSLQCNPEPELPSKICAGETTNYSLRFLCSDMCLSTTWDFGGLATLTGNTVSYSFPSPGTYTINCWVTDMCGLQSYVYTYTVLVEDCDCNQSLIATQTACNEFNFAMNCNACFSKMTINYGDMTPTEVCPGGCSFIHTYATDGTYNVTIAVFDCNGVKTFYTTTVVVNCDSNPKPCNCSVTAGFESSGIDPTNFFSASSAGPGTTITGYIWEFGDGSFEINNPNPIHDYASTDNYTICLTVLARNDDGSTCWDQLCRSEEHALMRNIGDNSSNNEESKFNIYPVPTSSKLSIEYYSKEELKNGNLIVTDIYSNEVFSLPISGNSDRFDLNVETLSAGTYNCSILDGKILIATKRFVVVR